MSNTPTTPSRFRSEFVDPNLPNWKVEVGAGMTVTAGAGGGLVVTTGTTVNSETRITSLRSFSVPVATSFGFKISQKIANQAFFVELIADDGNNIDSDQAGVDETVVAAWRVSGSDVTTTTKGRCEVRNGQAARSQSLDQTVAAVTADQVFDINIEEDEVWFYAKAIDSTVARTLSFMRNTVTPNPNRKYRLRYRIANLGTAPASSTTFTSLFALAREMTSQQVELRSASGGPSLAESLPVQVANVPAVTVTSTSLAASATVGGSTIQKVATAASTNAALVKATAARVYGWQFTNTAAAIRFVKLFNKATAPVPGTDTPVAVIAIPAGQTVTYEPSVPLAFATGLGISITAGAADNDTTVTAANDVLGHLAWI